MRPAFVHGCIGLKVLLNKVFVLLQHPLHLLLVLRVVNFVKVSPHSVLFVIEPVEVRPFG